jgi:hypothetical protein
LGKLKRGFGGFAWAVVESKTEFRYLLNFDYLTEKIPKIKSTNDQYVEKPKQNEFPISITKLLYGEAIYQLNSL